MKILNIAEKPSVAKSISYVLGKDVTRNDSLHKYIPTYSFSYNGDSFIFTSVLGHLTRTEFKDTRPWAAFDPKELFEMPLESVVIDYKIKKNLLKLSQNVDKIIIWTDCDREGEYIALEVKECIKKKGIKRAKFFAITRSEITNALENLIEINENEANAVKARIELDLRIGASFTRLQSLALKMGVISYGSCQVPTLGFVVDRNEKIKNFVPENFFSLNVTIKKAKENLFRWERGSLFDEIFVDLFHKILSEENFKVAKVEIKEVKKFKPYPLRTVELQKKCTSVLKMSSDEAMKIAEDLYNKGYISYPRTETNSFPNNFDFNKILTKLKSEEIYKNFTEFEKPRKGNKNDLAHLPIYPLKEGNGLSPKEKMVFDLVVKYFLGCCSKDAVGEETKVFLHSLGEYKEIFIAEGLKIKARNYLDVFSFDKWENKSVDDFFQDEVFFPLRTKETKVYALNKTKGKTSAPAPLTEADLIALMDKHGIGTDATIHEHIKKIQTRNYAIKRNKSFFPTKIGSSLIKGYDHFNFEFSTPKLRAELESKLKKIEEGMFEYEEVINEQLRIYKEYFIILQNRIEEFKNKFQEEERTFVKPPEEDSSSGEDSSGDNDNKKKKNNKSNVMNKENVKNQKINKVIDLTKERNEINSKNKSEFIPSDPEILKEKIKNKRIRCSCGFEPKIAEVKKESLNSGRTFLSCGKFPKKCNFFFWADDVDEYTVIGDIITDKKCDCGFDPKAEMAKNETNKGRIYLKCKKYYKPCKFFSWLD